MGPVVPVAWSSSAGDAERWSPSAVLLVCDAAGGSQTSNEGSVSFLISSRFPQLDKLYVQVQSSLFQIFN